MFFKLITNIDTYCENFIPKGCRYEKEKVLGIISEDISTSHFIADLPDLSFFDIILITFII